jgi:hypothetical protein
LSEFLLAQDIPEAFADPLGYGLVIVAITYLSFTVGSGRAPASALMWAAIAVVTATSRPVVRASRNARRPAAGRAARGSARPLP